MNIEQASDIKHQLEKEKISVAQMKPIELSALVGQVSSYWSLASNIEIKIRDRPENKD